MVDENEEIRETAIETAEAANVAAIAAEAVETANERAEIAEETNKALVDAAIEDRRETRLREIEERIGSWENRTAETQQTMNLRLEELANRQAEMLETLKTSLTYPNSSQPPIQVQTVEEPGDPVVVPVKTEALPEVLEETITPIIEPKPETKGVPGKRKIRLL